MVWLLNSQGMKNYKSTESFCLSIHKWLVPFLTCLLLLYFSFCKISKYVQAKNRLTHLNWHFMEWASMLTKLAGDDGYRLARFHPIRNFIANEIYHFLRLSHRTDCLFTLGSPFYVISSLFSNVCLFQNAILLKMLNLGFWNFKPIFLRIQFLLVAAFFFFSFSYLFELIFASYTVSWVFNIYIYI